MCDVRTVKNRSVENKIVLADRLIESAHKIIIAELASLISRSTSTALDSRVAHLICRYRQQPSLGEDQRCGGRLRLGDACLSSELEGPLVARKDL